jgi:hypothetical protein
MSHLYLKQNEYLSHPNLMSKCIGHSALREYLTFQEYLKQHEYLSHPILVLSALDIACYKGIFNLSIILKTKWTFITSKFSVNVYSSLTHK